MKKLCVSTKGQALVLVAISLAVLLALAGLAIDVGMAYGVRAKLNAAVDAAALAAGQFISQAEGRSADVERQAANVFNANYPAGLLGSSLTTQTNNATLNSDGSWTITVNATASVPTNFARMVGWNNFPVSVIATTTVRTVDLVLVLDSSNSLNDPPETPALLVSAAEKFTANFDTKNDRVGLIHFASGAVSDATITDTKGFKLRDATNKDGINDFIDKITFDGATSSEEAMRLALKQLDDITPGKRNSLRAIVFFSDGAPNCVAGNFVNNATVVQGNLYSEDSGSTAKYLFPLRQASAPYIYYDHIATLPSKDYSGTVNLQSDLIPPTRPLDPDASGNILNTRCNVNRAARNMLENLAYKARGENPNPIHIFTIGLGKSLLTPEVVACGYGTGYAESGENILRRLANVQGVDTFAGPPQSVGTYIHADSGAQLDAAFREVASIILKLSR